MPVTALTVYPDSFAASTTLSTANTLQTTTGGTGSSLITTKIGNSTGWGEVFSQGTANNWAAAGSMGVPSGHGWFLDATTLDAKAIVAGTWTPSWKLKASVNCTVTVSVNAYVYNPTGSVYTLIGSMTKASVALTSTATDPGITGVSFPTTLFPTGTKLYVDLWFNITVASGSSVATVSANESTTSGQGSTAAQITTPGYSAGYGQKDASARFRLALLKDAVTRFRLMSAARLQDVASRLSLALLKDTSARFRLALLKDTTTRFRVMSAIQYKDSATRFSLARVKDTSSRLLLALLKDSSTRLRLMSAAIFKDTSSRLRLALTRDASTRFTLGYPSPPTILGSDTAQRSQYFGGWGIATDGQAWASLSYGATLSVVPPGATPGVLQAIAPNNSGGRTFMVLGTWLPTDQELVCHMNMVTGGSTNDIGLIVRYEDTNNNVSATVTQAGSLRLIRRAQGVATTIASTSVTFSTSTYYWMRVRVVGSSYYVRFWADGSAEPASWTIDQTTDTALTSGGFGTTALFHATNDAVVFNYFYAVTYANVDTVVGTETLLDALAVSATDSVTISDSLPNYYPADSVTALESLLEGVTENAPVDILSTSESLLDASTLLQTDPLTIDDSATAYSFALNTGVDSSTLSDMLLAEEDPFSTDNLTVGETVALALAESTTDSIQTLFPVVDTFIGILSFFPTDTLSTSDLSFSTITTTGTDSVTLSASHLYALTFVPSGELVGTLLDSLLETSAFAPVESVIGSESLALAFAFSRIEPGASYPDVLLASLIEAFSADTLSPPADNSVETITYLPTESGNPLETLLTSLVETVPGESGSVLEELDLTFVFAPTDSSTLSDIFLLAPLALISSDTLSPPLDSSTGSFTLSVSDVGSLSESGVITGTFVPVESLSALETALYALAESVSESVSILDVLAYSSGITMSGTDSVTALDSLALSFLLAGQDAPTLSDVLRATSVLTFVAESVTASDAATTVTTLSVSENANAGDGLVLVFALTTADTAALLDVLLSTATLTFAADASVPSDGTSLFTVSTAPVADSDSVLESLRLALTTVPVDTTTATDVLALAFVVGFVADTVPDSDVLLATVQETVTDALTTSEILSLLVGFVPTEQVTSSDALSLAYMLTFASESAIAGDTLLTTVVVLNTDQSSLVGDLLSLALTFLPMDVGLLTESMGVSLVPLFAVDSVTGSDQFLSTLVVHSSDSAAPTPDILLLTLATSLTDSAATADILALAFVLSARDVVSILDSLVSSYSTLGVLAPDSVSAVEVLLATLVESGADASLTATDAFSFSLDFFVTCAAYIRSGTRDATIRSGTTAASVRDGTVSTSAR